MTTETNYPALTEYIAERSNVTKASDWCAQLRLDQAQAYNGGFADVAEQLLLAQADYKAQQTAKGFDGFPYNRAMGEFLGLPIRGNNEPPHGYYMATQVTTHFRLGAAVREVKELLASGAYLRLVAAKSKETGEPIRFTNYLSHQVQIDGDGVVLTNNRKRVRLSSNWSTETCMEAVAVALRTGEPYGSSSHSTPAIAA
jgi:hypothetical protein